MKKKEIAAIAKFIAINSYPSAVRVNRMVVDKADLVNDLTAFLRKGTIGFNKESFRDACYEK